MDAMIQLVRSHTYCKNYHAYFMFRWSVRDMRILSKKLYIVIKRGVNGVTCSLANNNK